MGVGVREEFHMKGGRTIADVIKPKSSVAHFLQTFWWNKKQTCSCLCASMRPIYSPLGIYNHWSLHFLFARKNIKINQIGILNLESNKKCKQKKQKKPQNARKSGKFLFEHITHFKFKMLIIIVPVLIFNVIIRYSSFDNIVIKNLNVCTV